MKDSTLSGALIPSGYGIWLLRAKIEQAGVSGLIRPHSGNARLHVCTIHQYNARVNSSRSAVVSSPVRDYDDEGSPWRRRLEAASVSGR